MNQKKKIILAITAIVAIITIAIVAIKILGIKAGSPEEGTNGEVVQNIETGNLSKLKAKVVKGNTDISSLYKDKVN